MSDRTNRLRNELVKTTPKICIERARIFTESMKQSEGLPIVKRRAQAYGEVLNRMSLYVRDGELIVGNQAEELRSPPVYPEYSTDWIEKEFDGDPYHFYDRPNDIYMYDEETKKELLSIIDYWRDKCLHTNLRKLLSNEILAAWDHGIIDDDWVTQNGFGNVMPDYEETLKTGLKGVIKKAQDQIDRLDLTEPGSAKKLLFLQSAIEANKAVIAYANRYADKLAVLADEEKDCQRKKELREMARICAKVPENPPDTFWEALQATWIIHLGVLLETNGIAISFGRFDQFMYPYYKQDIKKGLLTKEQALELVESFFIKVNEICVFRSWQGAKFFPGYHMAINLCIGGQTKDGRDAVNELSYICLDACENIKMPRPSLSVRWFEGTSDDFMDRCMQVVQAHGGGQPAFYNDKGVMKMLAMHGIEEEDRWNWAPLGCIESTIPGKFDFACKGPRMNIAKVFELTIHNGKDPVSGITCHQGKGDLSTFSNTDEVMDAFRDQLHYFMRLQVMLEHMNDEMHILQDINTFRASLIFDCIGRGKSLIEGGAKYSTEGGPSVGAMTAADGLSAIESIVFKEKRITGAQLLHAIDTDFKDGRTRPTGEEIQLMLLNKAAKYGNDDEQADKWAVAVTEYIGSTYVKEFKSSRFGKGPVPATYAFCQSSVTANVAMGGNVSATPDGRNAGKPLNNGISPSTGAECCGLTATINSASKLPSIWFSKGAIFNVRLTPEMLKTNVGRNRVVGIVKTLFQSNQYHIQFNVASTELLRDAQKNPRNYSDLMVRVAGYSAFFAPLNGELQEDIIRRAALE